MPELASPERVETLSDQVYAELRKAVLAGAFVPGQRMTIRGLAAEMKVSATPAREALNRLVAEGGLEYGPGKTVRVPAITAAKLDEIYLVRVPLEGTAAELGAARLGSRGIAKLEAFVERHAAALDRGDFRASLRENQGFHFTLYGAAERPLLMQVVEAMWLRIGPMMHLLYPTFEANRSGLRNHLAAIEAVRAGDGAALRRIVEKDLLEGRATMLRALAGQAPGNLGDAA
ncbi:GntR family transcriptional regulator [Siccirubricoccus sp. KC 17139]|uniref:GntR family transcriptional regulator n=1 Tax=Siccirubricoccus soli TaxID=2899147 RepID=A0ABT1D6D4_9PROT|nr:GntR family transcriptional regulator [Siccirubricoccus soli]MCO6416565.1 GntR family transcriptional regulator [Siccirubricoccus soli]MCP2682700.1 GntR family transcriptional regulator [Siccirubricoccus soli]